MAEHTFAGLRCSDVSDVAPSFVLGALELAESAAVRSHLAQCPEAHAEMAELNSAVPALFEAVDLVAPPASLRRRILDAAAAERTPALQPRPVVDTHRLQERARDTQRGLGGPDASIKGWARLFRLPVWAPVALAAALAVVALGAWNLQLRTEIDGLAAYRNGVNQVLQEATRPGAQLAVLAAPEGAGPTGLAAVGADGAVALVMRDLAPTSGAEVYEVWMIAGELAPVPIGELRVGADRTAALVTNQVPLGDGVTLALTREPGPDSTTPTQPIIAVGTAAARAS